jgi:hypothetical protein
VAAPLRYVVLHHTDIAEPHYDLMFERHAGGPLLTFRSLTWPIAGPTRIEPLSDHRREYLDCEGPVSGNRGQVKRIEGGTYEALSAPQQPAVLDLVLRERRVRLRLITAPPDAASIEPAD